MITLPEHRAHWQEAAPLIERAMDLLDQPDDADWPDWMWLEYDHLILQLYTWGFIYDEMRAGFRSIYTIPGQFSGLPEGC